MVPSAHSIEQKPLAGSQGQDPPGGGGLEVWERVMKTLGKSFWTA